MIINNITSLRVKILGCGAAAGVPMVSTGWGKCNPLNPKNNRLRSSIYLNINDDCLGVLFDSGPDLREQLLRANAPKIDAVVYTHLHADHTDGVNELREVNRINRSELPIYADEETLKSIKERFWYGFSPLNLTKEPLYHVLLQENLIRPYHKFYIKGIEFMPFLQGHGHMDTLGFRVGDFAYSTDAVLLDNRALEVLKGVKVWVVGCLDYGYHPTHAGVEQILKWEREIRPEMIYLTHMGNGLDYDVLYQELPANIRPAYDGLEILV